MPRIMTKVEFDEHGNYVPPDDNGQDQWRIEVRVGELGLRRQYAAKLAGTIFEKPEGSSTRFDQAESFLSALPLKPQS